MKIISNYKDYYDYIAGIYGIDDSIVYERHHQEIKSDYDYKKRSHVNHRWEKTPVRDYSNCSNNQWFFIALCGKIYFVIKYDGRFYFGEEAKPLGALMGLSDRLILNKNIRYHLMNTDLNEKEKCPVLHLSITKGLPVVISKNPRLSDFNFGSFMQPLEVFTMISEFITKEATVLDSRTDIQKIESNGLDKVTSFRKM